MVNESMQQCPFCKVTIDQQAAIAAAEVQDKANQATAMPAMREQQQSRCGVSWLKLYSFHTAGLTGI